MSYEGGGHCNFPFDFIDQFHAKTDWTCQYCGCKIWDRRTAARSDPARATIDHKIPIWRGGSENLDNLISSCNSCNQLKGSLTYDEYLKFRDNKLLLRVIRNTINRIKFNLYFRSQKLMPDKPTFEGCFVVMPLPGPRGGRNRPKRWQVDQIRRENLVLQSQFILVAF